MSPKITKRLPHRPTKLTPVVQEAICTAIRETACSDSAAAAGAGISPAALTHWKNWAEEGRQPYLSFVKAIEHARQEAEQNLARRMLVLAEGQGDWRAYSFLLERRFSALYGRHDKLALTIGRLSDDELIERAGAAFEPGAAGSPAGDGPPWLEIPAGADDT